MKAYKGFNQDMTCRGFQYEVGKTYELPEGEEVQLCHNGFHAIGEDVSPLQVFGYYPPSDSRYCEVDVDGKVESDGEKIVGSQIRIGAEIGIPGLVKAHIEWVKNHLIEDDEHKASNTGDRSSASNTGDRSSASNTGGYSSASNTGYRSSASNTGDRSSASNTGFQSSASNTGDQSSASNTGDRSSASNTGYRSSASNTGFQSSASNTGDRSSASNTGFQSSASNTGDRSSASNTGDQSSAEVSGKDSVAIVTGKDSNARGALGCWLVMTERNDDYEIVAMKCVKVDGDTVKADTWYCLQDGELTECE